MTAPAGPSALSGDDCDASPSSGRPTLATGEISWPGAMLSGLGIFLSLFCYSVLRSPIPAINEPHYLGKARHYWQPEWCAGDLLLESSSPHLVFYQTFGLLTRWMTLPQAAWAGRIVALLVLAWGFERLLSRLLGSGLLSLIAVWGFLLLHSLGNFSGEWLVGGVEAKVVAYGLMFAGLGALLDGRGPAGGLLLGLSVSFHPLVGGWSVIAVAMALAWQVARRQISLDWKQTGWAVLLCIGAALPGLIPALQTIPFGERELATQADLLQVGLRLKHHLDPMDFPLSAYRYFGLLLVVWMLVRSKLPADPKRRWFETFVAMSVVMAVAGFVVGWGPRPIETMPFAAARAGLLKFYPFRLADIMVPLMVALSGTAWAGRALLSVDTNDPSRWLLGAAAIVVYLVSLVLPHPDRNPGRMTAATQADWVSALSWVDTHTPTDALVYAANENWAVKWYARRAEYVSYKDCPQDAAGIVEWRGASGCSIAGHGRASRMERARPLTCRSCMRRPGSRTSSSAGSARSTRHRYSATTPFACMPCRHHAPVSEHSHAPGCHARIAQQSGHVRSLQAWPHCCATWPWHPRAAARGLSSTHQRKSRDLC